MVEIHVPVFSCLLGGIILTALYLITRRHQSHRAQPKIIRQYGRKAPARLPLKDSFFGTDAIYGAVCASKTKTFRNHVKGHYERFGNTFSSKLSILIVISTIEPENIKTILPAAFKEYIVGAPRRDAFLPILGDSIFLADGAQWEHLRALIRPSFATNHVSHLATLKMHVADLITAILCDGSIVDLGDLFLRYVADVTTEFMFGESIGSLSHPESF